MSWIFMVNYFTLKTSRHHTVSQCDFFPPINPQQVQKQAPSIIWLNFIILDWIRLNPVERLPAPSHLRMVITHSLPPPSLSFAIYSHLIQLGKFDPDAQIYLFSVDHKTGEVTGPLFIHERKRGLRVK